MIRPRRLDGAGDRGSAVLLAMTLLVVVGVAGVLVVDLSAYLAAAGRAQGAADAAALAAATVAHPRGRATGDPATEARRVVRAWDARLDRCRCPVGAQDVDVVVSTEVRALIVTRFTGRRVRARASATLVPP